MKAWKHPRKKTSFAFFQFFLPDATYKFGEWKTTGSVEYQNCGKKKRFKLELAQRRLVAHIAHFSNCTRTARAHMPNFPLAHFSANNLLIHCVALALVIWRNDFQKSVPDFFENNAVFKPVLWTRNSRLLNEMPKPENKNTTLLVFETLGTFANLKIDTGEASVDSTHCPPSKLFTNKPEMGYVCEKEKEFHLNVHFIIEINQGNK